MKLVKTLRWFGKNDPVTLSDIKQTGATGIVTALHHIPNGEVWSKKEILTVKEEIESHGLSWEVVESLPVTEDIKKATAKRDEVIANYKESVKNLGECGIKTICYNFMPVLDWARTDLQYKLADGGEAMYFNASLFAAFDMFILKRPDAELDYTKEQLDKAKGVYDKMTKEEADALAHNIIIVTQSFIDGAVDENEKDPKSIFLKLIAEYDDIDKNTLRENFACFLNEVIPVAEEYGVNFAVHPDDPPFPLLGLPRIVSSAEDFEWLEKACPSLNNGITFCAGSLSAGVNNDLPKLFKRFGERVHFLHLRSTQLVGNGDFYEASHLEGNARMMDLMKAIIEEQKNRNTAGRSDLNIPMRPDHGHKILDDYNRKSNPGYPLIGRLKGLAELSGLECGMRYLMK